MFTIVLGIIIAFIVLSIAGTVLQILLEYGEALFVLLLLVGGGLALFFYARTAFWVIVGAVVAAVLAYIGYGVYLLVSAVLAWWRERERR